MRQGFGFPAALLALATLASARAGVPLLTDDPGTVDPRGWELDIAVVLADFQDNSAWEAPTVALAYGVTERLEVGVALPFLIVDNQGEDPRGDLGNATVAGKWRFLDEQTHGLAMSTAPALSFNTRQRSVDQGIVDRGTVFTLPVEIGRTVGPVDLYGEVGRDFFESGTDRWFYGVAVEWPFHDRWTLAGELFGISTRDFDDSELLVNGGLRCALRDNLFLMGSVGVPVRQADTDPTRFITYLGIQWVFPDRAGR